MRRSGLHRIGLAGAALLCAALVGGFGCRPLPVLKMGGDFTLTDTRGGRWSLADQRGNVVLLFFGFTHCPDFCPATLSKVGRAFKELGADERRRVRTVLVTVDPERDTPAKLAEYVGGFSVNGLGLTGSLEEIRTVVKQYGGMFQKSKVPMKTGYMVDHSPYLYVIDQQGRVRHLFRFRDKPEDLVRVLNRLL